jgi:CRP-like cAMP-binding protein
VTSFNAKFTHLATARALTDCRGYLLSATDFLEAADDSSAASRWLEAATVRYITSMRKGHVHLHREGRTPLTDVLDTGGMTVPTTHGPQTRSSIYELHSSIHRKPP